jgi:hypothetical protein
MTRHSAVCVWIPLVASCARPRRIYGFAAIHGVVGAWRWCVGRRRQRRAYDDEHHHVNNLRAANDRPDQ